MTYNFKSFMDKDLDDMSEAEVNYLKANAEKVAETITRKYKRKPGGAKLLLLVASILKEEGLRQAQSEEIARNARTSAYNE